MANLNPSKTLLLVQNQPDEYITRTQALATIYRDLAVLDAAITAIQGGTVTLTEVVLGDGTAAAPSMTYTTDQTTGLYLIGAGNLGVSISGTKIFEVLASGTTTTGAVTGTTLVATATATAGGFVLSDNGTVSLPAIAWSGDLDTGLYRIGANNLGVAVGGAKIFDLTALAIGIAGITTITSSNSSALAIGPSGATNPALQIDASTASMAAGLKVTGATAAGNVALAVISSGSNANLLVDAKGSGTITIGSVSTGAISLARATSVTGAFNATTTVSAGTTSSATTQFLGADGAVAQPSYSFTNDPNTGIFSSAANVLGFVTNGAERWVINASGAFNPSTDNANDIGNGTVNPRNVHATTALIANTISELTATVGVTIDSVLLKDGAVTFVAVEGGTVANNTIFVQTGTNVLSFKNSAGAVSAVDLTPA